MSTDRDEEEAAFQEGFDRATHGVSRKDLDAMGERAVRDKFNSGDYGYEGVAVFGFVSAWLKDAEFARELEMAANDRAAAASARLAARWAMYAAIIAVIAIAIANKDQIFALMFGSP